MSDEQRQERNQYLWEREQQILPQAMAGHEDELLLVPDDDVRWAASHSNYGRRHFVLLHEVMWRALYFTIGMDDVDKADGDMWSRFYHGFNLILRDAVLKAEPATFDLEGMNVTDYYPYWGDVVPPYRLIALEWRVIVALGPVRRFIRAARAFVVRAWESVRYWGDPLVAGYRLSELRGKGYDELIAMPRIGDMTARKIFELQGRSRPEGRAGGVLDGDKDIYGGGLQWDQPRQREGSD